MGTGRNYSNASEYWRNKINLSQCGTRQCHFFKRTKILGTLGETIVMQVSIGEIRLTRANVEPDSAIF